MSEDDRRIRRTRRALADALIALAGQRPYESITIRDITEQADVGYATFYRHFDGKDALMLGIFQEFARDLEAMAAQHAGDFFEQEGLLIFAHVREHTALYRSILDSLVFTRKLKRLLSEHIGRHIAEEIHPDPNPIVPIEIAVNHMASAIVGLIEWWLAHALQPPIERMAQIYNRIVIQATWQALTADPHPSPAVAPSRGRKHEAAHSSNSATNRRSRPPPPPQPSPLQGEGA